MKEVQPLDTVRIRALLFDLDGTLSDTDDYMVARVRGLFDGLESVIRPMQAHRFARWFVRTVEGPGNWLLWVADKLGVDGILAKLLDLRAEAKSRQDDLIDHFPIIPGIVPMLDALNQRFPMAIVSARNERTTRLFLEVHQLEKYFPVVVSSQTCARTKPFPDPLLYAANALNVKVDQCLMVGDTVTDVRAAHAAGTQSLSVLCGFGQEEHLRKAGTQMVLPSTSQLGAFLTSGPLAMTETPN